MNRCVLFNSLTYLLPQLIKMKLRAFSLAISFAQKKETDHRSNKR